MPVYRCVELTRYSSPVECRTTHYFQTLDPFLEADLEDVADLFHDLWDTHLKAEMSVHFSIYGVSVQRVDIADQPAIVVPVTPVVGTKSANTLPVQVAMVVNFRSFTERPNYARKFLPGWCEDDTDGALPGEDQKDAALAWAQALIAVNLIGSTSVDYRTVRFDPLTGLSDLTNPLTTAQVSPYWGTQRRRRQGRGI